MSEISPFEVSRFEHGGIHRHLYFLPREIIETLETPHPTYLIGSRGTGKTTFLNALNWRERLKSPSLKKQLDGKPFTKRYIGLYLRMPEFQLSVFEKWLEPYGIDLYAIYLSFFLDLAWLELLCECLSELIAESILSISPGDEHATTSQIIDIYPAVFSRFLRPEECCTLKAMARIFRDTRRSLIHFAFNRANPGDVLSDLGISQIGEFGRAAASRFAAMCDAEIPEGEMGWHFKPCLDESETLNANQQRILNSIVRLSSWPVFPVVSYVGLPYDITDTVSSNLTLQKADRHLRQLDQMDEEAFREFAIGVSLVRVRHILNDNNVDFDLGGLLGSLNVNVLLQSLLKATASENVVNLLEAAAALGRDPFFAARSGDGSKPDPIYQAYLIDRLRIQLPKPGSPRWVERAQDSAELRKRSVAAYLSICSEFSFKPLYASEEMVLQMSDRCMRDFLSQMHEIFFETTANLREFLKIKVSVNVQDRALRRASRQKHESIPRSEVRMPKETKPLVEGLGRITAFVQTNSPGGEHLRSSERGTFEVQTAGGAADIRFEHVLRLVRDAAEAGFLKMEQGDGAIWRFRVHTSLAAAFGFSYRGAYYPIRVSLSDLDRLTRCASADELTFSVNELGRRLSGQDDEALPLFEWAKE